MDITRGDGWLQKILYLVMVLLGTYIIYKGGGLLMKSDAVKTALDGGTVQRSLEDAAMRSWALGYSASVERKNGSGWLTGWMRQVVPVYSYLAERAEESEETEEKDDGNRKWPEEAKEGDEPSSDRQPVSTPSGKTPPGKESGEDQLPEETKAESDPEVPPGKGSGEDQLPEETKAEPDQETPPGKESGEDQLPEETKAESNQETLPDTGEVREVAGRGISAQLREQLSDYEYLRNQYFIVDGGTTADEELLDADRLLSCELGIERNPEVPQILIYHTHSQEDFIDSGPGEEIVGMGETLAGLLTGYGYQVIHDTSVYDLVDGVLDRSAAYDYARAGVERILEEHPTIEVIIDLHRDGVDGQKFVTEVDGKPTSMIMFFNGISRNSKDEPLTYLANPYISENLAFSLQMELKAREQYPGFTRNIYLKAERFNLHLRPRSLLVEAGTQLNTVEEERNAMTPLADLLNQVLSGK